MQRTEMQRGNQRYEKMIGRQAAKEDHEPALRKTANVEEADKHHTRNNKDEKYRQQPVEIDGCEINEPQNHYPQPERAPYLFSTGTTTISSGFWARFCDAEPTEHCCRSHASEWAAAIARVTRRSSDVWMVLPGKFRLKSAVASA